MDQATWNTVCALLAAVKAKDDATAVHSKSVSRFATRFAYRLGFANDVVERVSVGALLHDVGKIGIPDAVLQKQTSLTPEDYACIQTHPNIGVEILKSIPSLDPYVPVVASHHEWWNGQGYPQGLRHHAIPYEAQLVAFCDVYDAMKAHRPYRKPLGQSEVLAVMENQVGQQLSPEMWPIFQDFVTENESILINATHGVMT